MTFLVEGFYLIQWLNNSIWISNEVRQILATKYHTFPPTSINPRNPQSEIPIPEQKSILKHGTPSSCMYGSSHKFITGFLFHVTYLKPAHQSSRNTNKDIKPESNILLRETTPVLQLNHEEILNREQMHLTKQWQRIIREINNPAITTYALATTESEIPKQRFYLRKKANRNPIANNHHTLKESQIIFLRSKYQRTRNPK